MNTFPVEISLRGEGHYDAGSSIYGLWRVGDSTRTRDFTRDVHPPDSHDATDPSLSLPLRSALPIFNEGAWYHRG